MKPKDYYREKKILHRVVNKLVTGSEGRKLVVVHDDTAYSIHSLTGLVVENQLNNISVAKALHLDNLRVHKKTGEYAFLVLDETNTQPLSPETEVEDFEALYAAIVELLKLTHGRDALTLLPPVFVDFLKKLLADSLNVQHIVAHALFLPLLSRVLLRLLLDLMLRRPLRTRYCPHREAITEMMNAMPYVDDNGAMLTSIVNQNDCLSSWQKRNAEDQQKWLAKDGVSGFPKEEAPQTELSGPLKVAGRLIGIQRDGVLHYKNTELPATLLQGIDLKKVVQMLNIEFPEFEQKTLELLAKHGLWDHSEVGNLFGKYAARLKEVIERDKRRADEKSELALKAPVAEAGEKF